MSLHSGLRCSSGRQIVRSFQNRWCSVSSHAAFPVTLPFPSKTTSQAQLALASVAGADMKEYVDLVNGRVELAQAVLAGFTGTEMADTNAEAAQSLDAEIVRLVGNMTLKPCAEPGILISLGSFEARIFALKSATTPDALKQGEMELNSIEVQYHQLCRSLTSSSGELAQAKKDNEARKKKLAKEQEKRVTQAEQLASNMAQAEAKAGAQPSGERRKASGAMVAVDKVVGGASIFNKPADFAPLPGIHQNESATDMENLDFVSPFVLEEATAMKEFIKGPAGQSVMSCLELFEATFEASGPCKSSGRANSKLKYCEVLPLQEHCKNIVGHLEGVEAPLAAELQGKFVPTMWGIAKGQQFFGLDFLGMPTLRFQACRWVCEESLRHKLPSVAIFMGRHQTSRSTYIVVANGVLL